MLASPPHVFALAGRRLVYTAGILFLAAGAGLLLSAFDGITDRLIPLFAVGAFLSFTLSRAGMAQHWRRAGPGRANRARLWNNGLGALSTATALAIILVAKFAEGAWITVAVIPATLALLRLVRRYYDDLDRLLLAGESERMNLRAPPLVVPPVGSWDSISRNGVDFALRLSPDVTALHCIDLEGPDGERDAPRPRDRRSPPATRRRPLVGTAAAHRPRKPPAQDASAPRRPGRRRGRYPLATRPPNRPRTGCPRSGQGMTSPASSGLRTPSAEALHSLIWECGVLCVYGSCWLRGQDLNL